MGNQRFRTAWGTGGSREAGNQRDLAKGDAKSTGARETNVPEERSVAVRRDGEPLASAAKERRQKEVAADRHHAVAGERPPSSIGEETRSVPLSDPRCKLLDTVRGLTNHS